MEIMPNHYEIEHLKESAKNGDVDAFKELMTLNGKYSRTANYRLKYYEKENPSDLLYKKQLDFIVKNYNAKRYPHGAKWFINNIDLLVEQLLMISNFLFNR